MMQRLDRRDGNEFRLSSRYVSACVNVDFTAIPFPPQSYSDRLRFR